MSILILIPSTFADPKPHVQFRDIINRSRAGQAPLLSRRAKVRAEPSLPLLSKRSRSSLSPNTLPPSTHLKHDYKPKLSAHTRPHRSLPAHLPSTSLFRSPAPPTPAPSHAFPSTLTTFLTSLHPSLSVSAPILFDAGIKDTSLLVAFLALDDSTREAFLVDAKIALLQRHLLKARVKQAREGGREVVG